MEKVAYDVLPSYPIPPKNKVWGEARNPQTGKCLDRMGGIPGPLGVNGCHGYGGNQLIRLNTEGQLAQGEWCLTPKGVRVEANHCVKGTVNGPWAYEEHTKEMAYGSRLVLPLVVAQLCGSRHRGGALVKIGRCAVEPPELIQD
ncbi:ricin-type beta-trefoil lectin domain protein [Teladorsagia circumcincta]|uniref:Ricin-type beta-trefoil lectin domain protein n=1 Tax=Teladorsagia circumcincta TaxID=45464 RepID=A0A2G9U6Y2_TELCI|nr:ricin-type beta-trefoil lectin domain protein [Teladorsagia circumcincta]